MNFLSSLREELQEEELNKNIIDEDLIEKMLSELDEDQRKVVQASFNPILCNAIAGSGKTRVLTYRLSYLLANGVKPSEIILLTFTNKAAREMVDRVVKLTDINPKELMGGTFHHIAGRFLRKYSSHLGYKSNFTIYTPEDSKDLLKWITSEEIKEYEGLKRNFPKSSAIYAMYSSCVNKNKNLNEILDQNGFSKQVNELIINIISRYLKHKKENNIMDFDDLLVNFEKILKIDEIRNKISSRYKYLFVDEYQDVNDLQASIVKLLNNDNPNIFVVGDLNQSIYEFRGSNIKNILKFRDEYKNCQVFPLRYNYRSQGAILDLASDSINRNKQKEKIEMLPFIKHTNKPQVRAYKTVFTEADGIAKNILDKKRNNKDFKFSDNAILVRNNIQTNALEFTFKRYNIPFRLLSGKSFIERKHIRDIISFLKFYANPKDEV
ncbi:MAG: ATP-dependent helicase, partial [Romboutsia sp.]|nr:ATP-dependent helicase [Romboutsia sp.]